MVLRNISRPIKAEGDGDGTWMEKDLLLIVDHSLNEREGHHHLGSVSCLTSQSHDTILLPPFPWLAVMVPLL